MIVNVDNQHLHRVANSADGIDTRYISAGQFADMAQTIFAWKDLDKGTEITNAGNNTVIDLADLNGGRASFNASQCGLGRISIGACHCDVPFVVNIDRRSGVFLNRTDVLASRTNQQTNLVWIDFGPEQPRSVATDFSSRSWDACQHLSKDFDSSIASLLERGSDDLFTDPIDL
jgi:hypothetical protein